MKNSELLSEKDAAQRYKEKSTTEYKQLSDICDQLTEQCSSQRDTVKILY